MKKLVVIMAGLAMATVLQAAYVWSTAGTVPPDTAELSLGFNHKR